MRKIAQNNFWHCFTETSCSLKMKRTMRIMSTRNLNNNRYKIDRLRVRADKFCPIFQWRDLVDLVVVVVGPSHLLGMGEVVAEVTPVEVVERIPVVVGEDLIMSGAINEITCVAGHLLVMVW